MGGPSTGVGDRDGLERRGGGERGRGWGAERRKRGGKERIASEL